MKVNLKLWLIILVLVIILGSIIVAWLKFGNQGMFHIEILNSTSETIGDLKISYEKIAKEIVISGIPPKASVKLVFKPGEQFGENAMWLSYQDKNGKIHKQAIFGYFEKGYRGKALIKIIAVEPNGSIKFEIKSKIKI
jgi:hypothetical protein